MEQIPLKDLNASLIDPTDRKIINQTGRDEVVKINSNAVPLQSNLNDFYRRMDKGYVPRMADFSWVGLLGRQFEDSREYSIDIPDGS